MNGVVWAKYKHAIHVLAMLQMVKGGDKKDSSYNQGCARLRFGSRVERRRVRVSSGYWKQSRDFVKFCRFGVCCSSKIDPIGPDNVYKSSYSQILSYLKMSIL